MTVLRFIGLCFGMLGRLFLKFRPTWHVDYFFQKPRRSIDRDLQEQWPTDYPL